MSIGKNDVHRTYRQTVPGLNCYRVAVGETDLWIETSLDCKKEIESMVRSIRIQLRDFIEKNPVFRATLEPWDPERSVGPIPEIASMMMQAARQVGVGPMAAVAGATAGMVGKALYREGETLIIENGGDIFISTPSERLIGVFAGDSPFSQQIALRIPASISPLGICTSAGTVGPSFSFGKADAVVVLAPDPALADAAASAIGNRVQTAGDLESVSSWSRNIPGLLGVLIVAGSALAAWGAIELVPIRAETGE